MVEKEVFKFKGDECKIEIKPCHPRKLGLTANWVAPYWWEAFRNVFMYEKRRDLQDVHKLVDDRRIRKGLELYRNKHILENVVTKHNEGDVHAQVKSQKGDKMYRVMIKNYLPYRLPQYTFEREEYLANLVVTCQCDDHAIGRYRDNSSILCVHSCAVIWFLIEKFNMPKIFIMPEERVCGWQKSEPEDLEVEIRALPLVKFTQHLNILLLKKYRGMKAALGMSLHKVDNTTHKEESKPQWLTFTEPNDVERIIRGTVKAYRGMMKDRNAEQDEIEHRIRELCEIKIPEQKPPEKKPLWRRLFGYYDGG